MYQLDPSEMPFIPYCDRDWRFRYMRTPNRALERLLLAWDLEDYVSAHLGYNPGDLERWADDGGYVGE